MNINNQNPNLNNGTPVPTPSAQPQAMPTPGVQPQVVQTPNVAQTVSPQAPMPQAQSVVQPQATVAPVNNVAPTPMPATGENTQPTHMPSDPNGNIPPVNVVGGMPVINNEEVPVINTTKHKTSYFALFFVIALLFGLVFYMDEAVSYYEKFYNKYIKSGSLTSNNNSSDNLSNGYILIGETTSSKKESDILFNNFVKAEDNKITFNYSPSINKSNVADLNIYIELYDADKHLLYKELFTTPMDIVGGTTTMGSITTIDSIYNNASYVIVRTIKDLDIKTLTCTKEDENYKYKNTYNFKNDSIVSFEVSKTSILESNNLENEYNLIKDTKNATLEDNTLKYSVDLNTITNEMYHLGESNYYVKVTEEAKEWKCE